jgi:hypothetical protein
MDPGNCIEYRPEGDCSCWPMDSSIEGTALSTGPQGSQLQTVPESIDLPTFAAAGHGIQGCASAGAWIQGTASSTGPKGIAAATRLGVDHPMELQPGPQGIATANRLGVLHSIELQPGPHGIQGCASCRRMDSGNCIEYRPAGDCIMLARSALITRWDSNQVPMDPRLCILLALGSRVVHTSGA